MKFIRLNYWKSLFYNVPLSKDVKQKIAVVFKELDRPKASELIRRRCGTSLPMMKTVEIEDFDRIRFAVIKLSRGNVGKLEELIDQANVDWRDILVDAGFADDEKAHLAWEA